MAKREAKVEALSYEEAVDQLEALIEQIESGEIGLEESLKQYERGMALIHRCRTILEAAEEKIAELTVTPEGGLRGPEAEAEGEVEDGEEPPI